MRRILLIGLLFFATTWSLSVQAQTLFGLKDGVNLPRLYYSDPSLGDLTHRDTLRLPSAGLFVEFPLHNQLSLAPEINRQYRGGIVTYRNPAHGTTTYQMDACYLNMRVPICYYLLDNPLFSPYLLAGPDLGYAYKGTLLLDQPGMPIPKKVVALSSSNIQRFYLGALAGAGIRLNINVSKCIFVMKLDAAFNCGFLDTFSPQEKQETAHAANIYAYNHQGNRMSRGLEAHLSLGLIFKSGMKDACGNFQSHYKRKKVSYVW